jgi:hypothetical protein
LSQKIWGDSRDQVAYSVVVDGIGNIFLAGSAPDTIGIWQDITGTTGTPTGELTSPSGSVGSPAGVITSPTAIMTNPSGVIDTGGGGADMILLKLQGLLCGDANRDGVINVVDVVYLINYVYINGPAPDPLEIGDVDSDGVVDITDAVYLIKYLFLGGPPPGC